MQVHFFHLPGTQTWNALPLLSPHILYCAHQPLTFALVSESNHPKAPGLSNHTSAVLQTKHGKCAAPSSSR